MLLFYGKDFQNSFFWGDPAGQTCFDEYFRCCKRSLSAFIAM